MNILLVFQISVICFLFGLSDMHAIILSNPHLCCIRARIIEEMYNAVGQMLTMRHVFLIVLNFGDVIKCQYSHPHIWK